MVSSSHKPLEISDLKATQLQPPIVSSQDLGWESFLIEEFKQPPGVIETGIYKDHTICLCLTTKPNRIWQTLGDRSYVGLYTRGDITIAPAQLPCSYRTDNEDRYLQITITPRFLKLIATEAFDFDPDRLELTTEFRTRNSRIEQLAMMLRAELHRGSSRVGTLYVESLANALAIDLLRGYSGTKPHSAIYEGGLGDRKLLQVLEYINEYLEQDIKLADLAKLLEMSRFHFSRLFRQSIGISPHQYLLQQRIERAKQLLKQTDKPIVEIALMCGFNSHSHLSKQFKQLTSLTPKAYRASL